MTREEALDILMSANVWNDEERTALGTLLPEFRMSEDERIRKDIINLIYWLKGNPSLCSQYYKDRYDGILAWLEKQEIFSKNGEGCYYYHADGSYTFIGSMGFGPIEDIKINGERPKTENKGVNLPGACCLEEQKEQEPIIQDVELNDAVYDYVRDHFIAGADFTPEYIKKLMENAFFAGVDYYLLKQESESCEPDTNVEKVIEDVIRVYGKTQGEWVGGYDVDTLIVNLRRAFNKKEQKPVDYDHEMWKNCEANFEGGKKEVIEHPEKYGLQKPAEWSEEDEEMLKCCLIAINHYEKTCNIGDHLPTKFNINGYLASVDKVKSWLKSLRPQPKQEWSEEDEDTINLMIAILRENHPNSQFKTNPVNTTCMSVISTDMLIKRIESLRPSWKPSEEQMKALWKLMKYAVSLSSYYDIQKEIEFLYNDLNKLK